MSPEKHSYTQSSASSPSTNPAQVETDQFGNQIAPQPSSSGSSTLLHSQQYPAIPSQLGRQNSQRLDTQNLSSQLDHQQRHQKSYQPQVQTQTLSCLDPSLQVQSIAPPPPPSSQYTRPAQCLVPPPPSSSCNRPSVSSAPPPPASSQISSVQAQSIAPPPPSSFQRSGPQLNSQYNHYMASRQPHITSMSLLQRAEQEHWAITQLNNNANSAVCNQGKLWYRCTEKIAGAERGGYKCEGGSHFVTDELLAEGEGGFMTRPLGAKMELDWAGPFYDHDSEVKYWSDFRAQLGLGEIKS
ncbi:hypothetical protein BGZ60DRAFT_433307 [Tricladium varicosporioides]|nr:hypothetical protein BGZ60DRAFT_433307 [Hymenoscyphus varicosporioides]